MGRRSGLPHRHRNFLRRRPERPSRRRVLSAEQGTQRGKTGKAGGAFWGVPLGCDKMQCYNVAFDEINSEVRPKAQQEPRFPQSTLNGILNVSRKGSEESGYGSAAKRRVSACGVCDECQQSFWLRWPCLLAGKL